MANALLHLDVVLTEMEREYKKAVPCTQGPPLHFSWKKEPNEKKNWPYISQLYLHKTDYDATADGIALSLKKTCMLLLCATLLHQEGQIKPCGRQGADF